MKVLVGSEMARNANENEFQTSKKNMKVAFWSEMVRNANEN